MYKYQTQPYLASSDFCLFAKIKRHLSALKPSHQRERTESQMADFADKKKSFVKKEFRVRIGREKYFVSKFRELKIAHSQIKENIFIIAFISFQVT